jgi:cell division protein FtsB
MRIRVVGERPLVSTVRKCFAVAGASAFLLMIGYRAMGPSGYMLWQQREQEKQKLEREVRQLTLEHVRLAGEVERLKNDPKAIEKVARQELKLAKPDEYIYVLPAPTATTRRSADER